MANDITIDPVLYTRVLAFRASCHEAAQVLNGLKRRRVPGQNIEGLWRIFSRQANALDDLPTTDDAMSGQKLRWTFKLLVSAAKACVMLDTLKTLGILTEETWSGQVGGALRNQARGLLMDLPQGPWSDRLHDQGLKILGAGA